MKCQRRHYWKRRRFDNQNTNENVGFLKVSKVSQVSLGYPSSGEGTHIAGHLGHYRYICCFINEFIGFLSSESVDMQAPTLWDTFDSERGNRMASIVARLIGSTLWTSHGDVTFYEAARREALEASRSRYGVPEYEWQVEVKDAIDDTIPACTVRVAVKLVAEVIEPRRGAE